MKPIALGALLLALLACAGPQPENLPANRMLTCVVVGTGHATDSRGQQFPAMRMACKPTTAEEGP